jgi:outer membrane protein assembly factor BamE (lipoprotein component of BamABCDE complex)
MGTGRETRRRRSELALLALLALGLSGCEIVRVYQGSQLTADPYEWINSGQTTKSDVLRVFGPPDLIQRQLDGDVFTYAYLRKDTRTFTIEEPVITDLEFLTYTRIDEKSDRLVVLFDKAGVVSAFGYRRSTEELPQGLTGRTPGKPSQRIPPPSLPPASTPDSSPQADALPETSGIHAESEAPLRTP